MFQFLRLFLLCVFALALAGGSARAAQVKAVVRFAGEPPHAFFVTRLENTMQAVVKKALENAPDWQENTETYQEATAEVLEQALRGYRVRDMNLSQQNGVIYASASLAPFGELIQSVRLTADVNPMSTMARDILVGDLKKVKKQLEAVWKDLPASNAPWAERLLVAQAKELVAKQPDLSLFVVSVEAALAKTTTVHLSLRAKAPVLRDVNIHTTSTLLPNVLMEEVRFALAGSLRGLRGLPMALLARHESLIQNTLKTAFAGVPITRRLKLQAAFQSDLGEGESLTVQAKVGSPRFRLLAGGHLDVGHAVEEGRLDAHAGFSLGKYFEVFAEPSVELKGPKLVSDVGVGLVAFEGFNLSVGRDLTNRLNKWWVSMRLAPDWSVSYEKRAVQGTFRELGLLYRVNDFYTLGLFTDLDADTWVRLRANL